MRVAHAARDTHGRGLGGGGCLSRFALGSVKPPRRSAAGFNRLKLLNKRQRLSIVFINRSFAGVLSSAMLLKPVSSPHSFGAGARRVSPGGALRSDAFS